MDAIITAAGVLTHECVTLQEDPSHFSTCPQPPLLAYGPRAEIPHLMSARGTEVDVWRLGRAKDRQVGGRNQLELQCSEGHRQAAIVDFSHASDALLSLSGTFSLALLGVMWGCRVLFTGHHLLNVDAWTRGIPLSAS
jgi:hypothetical protein